MARATSRQMFGQTLADFQLTQASWRKWRPIDGAPLLVYRAAAT